MADNYPVPPPPPQAHKPMPPPPPPGRVGMPSANLPAGLAGALVPPAPMAKPAPAPIPRSFSGGMPPLPGSIGMPIPGAPGETFAKTGSSPLEQRLLEMEKRFQEQEAARKSA